MLLSVAANAEAATYYIKENGNDNNNGYSWGNAAGVGKLRALLSDSSGATTGDVIYVASGTYTPVTPSNTDDVTHEERTATFKLNKGVKVYGGFKGTETGTPEQMLAARDIQNNTTTLSGEIGKPNNISDNSYHVVTGGAGAGNNPNDTNSYTVLDGFTITGGNAEGFGNNSKGGGMFNYNSSPTVTNCTFSGNTAGRGGGMYNYYNSSPTVTNCIFWESSIGGGDASKFTYCVIQGGSSNTYNGTGNVFEDPKLETNNNAVVLKNNGGPTQTIAINVGSPAIGTGKPNGAPATDQRGYLRNVAPCIGAFEYYDSGVTIHTVTVTAGDGGTVAPSGAAGVVGVPTNSSLT